MAIDPNDETLPLLLGRGRYVDDITPDKCLFVSFLRSPFPSATIGRVEADAARSAPGVQAVYTGADLAGVILPLEARMDEFDWFDYQMTSWPVMAVDRVRFAGEVVAAVVATNPYLAEDACALIDIDYDGQPAVATVTGGMADDAPRLHDELRDNVLFKSAFKTDPDADPFPGAAHRVSGSFRHPRVSPSPMECGGVLASYDRRTDTIEICGPFQSPHIARDGLARFLQHPESRIRISCPDIGGAFGVRMQLFPEDLVVAHAARALGRPVKWTQDRREHLLTSFHARDAYMEAELAADDDGRFLGLRVELWSDVGAYSSFPLGCSLEPHTALVGLPGPYTIPQLDFSSHAVATNKCPTGPYRGVGFGLAPLVTENLVDKMARHLGVDRMEIRRRNMVPADAFPFKSASGAIYDSGRYDDLFAKAIARADSEGVLAGNGTDGGGIRRGIGIACFIEPTGMGCNVFRSRGMHEIPSFDSALLRVNRSGDVEAYVTTPSLGQQQFTSMRKLLSEKLEVPIDNISVGFGDTDKMPYGSGTFASRGTVTGGGALQRAARRMIDKMKHLAAIKFGVEADNIVFEDGRFANGKNSNQILTFEEVSEFAHSPVGGLPADFDHGLQCTASFDNPGAAVSAAAHIALVEVDTQTGDVRVIKYIVAEDCGPIINMDSVEGQLHGAIAQGIGAALLEEVIYDNSAQLQSGTLADYMMPTSDGALALDIVHQETPSPMTEGGHKGMGESGTIGAPAAIASAVMDALGVDWSDIRLPLTPERVLALWTQSNDSPPA